MSYCGKNIKKHAETQRIASLHAMYCAFYPSIISVSSLIIIAVAPQILSPS